MSKEEKKSLNGNEELRNILDLDVSGIEPIARSQETQTQIKRLQNQIKEIKVELAMKDKLLKAQKDTTAALDGREKMLKAKLEACEKKCKAQETDISSLKLGLLQNPPSRISSSQSQRLQQLEEENKSLKKELSVLREVKASQNSDAQLQKSFALETSSIRFAAESKEKQIERLRGELNNLKVLHEQQIKRLKESIKKKNEDLDEQLQQLQKIPQQAKQITKLIEEKGKYAEETKKLREKLNLQEKQISTVKDQNQRLKAAGCQKIENNLQRESEEAFSELPSKLVEKSKVKNQFDLADVDDEKSQINQRNPFKKAIDRLTKDFEFTHPDQKSYFLQMINYWATEKLQNAVDTLQQIGQMQEESKLQFK